MAWVPTSTHPRGPPDAPKGRPDKPSDLPGHGAEAAASGRPENEIPKAESPRVETPGTGLRQLDAHLGHDVVMPPRDLLGGGKPPTGSRVIEVDAERWTPLREAFHFERAGDNLPPTIMRPPASGERIGVRYQLTATDQQWLFTLKVQLYADSMVGAQDLADLRVRTTAGVDHYLNDPGYRVPGAGVPLQVKVEFVDNPADAHAHITVTADPAAMDQAQWTVGASPAAYAHEIVHYLGVTDGQPPPDALLRRPGVGDHNHGDLMGGHGEPGPYVLVPGSLAQIAEVLAPHFSGSMAPRPETVTGPGHIAETTVKPANSLPGLYGQRPELLYEVDSIADLGTLLTGIDSSVNDVVHARVNATWKGIVPFLPGRRVKAPQIGQALEDDAQSFFATGGRSFDVQDGLGDWHRITVRPVWSPADATLVEQAADRAKFDTRTDHAISSSQSATSGGAGLLGVSVTIPQRIGPGGGFGGEIALSRPLEFSETSARLTDSHNVRSGSASNLVTTPTMFTVTAADVRGPLDGPEAVPPTVGTPVAATVTFRELEDLAKATPRVDQITVDLDKSRSLLVENLTPVRILKAGLNLPPGTAATDTWNDVIEQVLVRLAPTKAVDPGSIGRR